MKLRDESEIANLLGSAFASFANRIQNGATAPFRGLLTSESVEVTLRVGETGAIEWVPPVVEPLFVPSVEPPSQYKDDDSTEITIEEKYPWSKVESDADEPEKEAEIEIIEKPKRKRKTK